MQLENKIFVKKFIRTAEEGYKRGWHELNGGNLSYRMKETEVDEVKKYFNDKEEWDSIGTEVSDLANDYFLITGSGKFFGNIKRDLEENAAIIKVDESGTKYTICWGLKNGGMPTSELPTHLMNHQVKKRVTEGTHRVIYHAHTTNLIALTFVLPLKDETFTRLLWQMATECPVVFPDGVGVVEWMVPGGSEIAKATSVLMEKHDIAIWAHHGTFCSGESFDSTFGLMDTAEKAAEILVKVMSMKSEVKQTITTDNLKELAIDFGVDLPERFLN